MAYTRAEALALQAWMTQQRALLGQVAARIDVDALCFPEQARLVKDPSRNAVAVCGRRSGKTIAAVLRALIVALAMPDVGCLFIAATRESAKQLAWKALRRFNESLGLGGTVNWTDLSLTLPNGSTVHLRGVDTEKAADLVRGISRLAFAAVDEVQRGRPDVLTTLIKDVIRPALADVRGTLWLLGTPNPKGKLGVLWERWEAGIFSQHTWTIYENTKGFPTREALDATIQEDLDAENETKESAWFQREYLARWVVDLASRAYKFDDAINIYADLPIDLNQSLLCVDIGYGDADAIGDLAWNEDAGVMHLRREDIQRGQTVIDLGQKLSRLADDTTPMMIVVDAGGGGLKDLATLQQMLPRLPLQAAVKPDVHMQVKAMNNVLVHGRFKVRKDSQFAKDVRQVGWVKGVVGGKLDEAAFHSDIIPACRYGVMAATPFLPEIADAIPAELKAAFAVVDEQARRRARAMRQGRKVDPLAVEDGEEEWQEQAIE